jgi:hypothetical protein
MSHHGREDEYDYAEMKEDYSRLHGHFHKTREAIGSYIQGQWTSDELREFSIEQGIIPDPDKAIKEASAEIDKLEKLLKVAKAKQLLAIQSRKCKSDE